MCISGKTAHLPLTPNMPLTFVTVVSILKPVSLTHCYGEPVELQCLEDSQTCRMV